VIAECIDTPLCDTTTLLGTINTWFVKKLGVWKENDEESKESIDTEEIIFVEEKNSFDEYCFNIHKPVYEECKELECDMSSTNSIAETIEYETILDNTNDVGSDSSSECMATIADYLRDGGNEVNPVQDILQNVRNHDWKDYFQSSYLSPNEQYSDRKKLDFKEEQSSSLGNVELHTLGSEGSEGECTLCEITTQEAFGSIDLEMNEESEKRKK